MGRQGDRSRRPAAAQEIENEQGMGSSYKASRHGLSGLSLSAVHHILMTLPPSKMMIPNTGAWEGHFLFKPQQFIVSGICHDDRKLPRYIPKPIYFPTIHFGS